MLSETVDMARAPGRRVSRSHGEETLNCSQQSILSAMDRFVKSVNNMDATVLVPSKLRDMDTHGNKVNGIPAPLADTDLYSFYVMLNHVKKELLWGPGTGLTTIAQSVPLVSAIVPQAINSNASVSQTTTINGIPSTRPAKHSRQPSDDSLGSIYSTASSSDADTDSEADSMITDRDSADEQTSHLAAAFRHHLQGLHTILSQLADSADYLSSRYQEDIDSTSF